MLLLGSAGLYAMEYIALPINNYLRFAPFNLLLHTTLWVPEPAPFSALGGWKGGGWRTPGAAVAQRERR